MWDGGHVIEVSQVRIDGYAAFGFRVDLPDSPPLVAVIGDKGFVMCGFLNVDAAEKLGVTAAVVSGVRTFDDVLEAEVKAVTSKAEMRGIRRGMTGLEALRLLF
jgi:uncharacterized protein YunC (DUF1805 family)